MLLNSKSLCLLSLWLAPCLGDFLGPTYPPPMDLSSNDSLIPAAWSEFTDFIDGYLNGNADEATSELLGGLENVTFSIGVFSLNDPAASENLQYHYTSQEVSSGGREVDGDTIYQLASITKLFTVYAGLLELTLEQWNTPLTKCIPALGQYVQNQTGEDSAVTSTQWDQITPWALANQLGGLSTNPWLLDTAFTTTDPAALEAIGLPITPEVQELLISLQSADSLDEETFLAVATLMPSVLAPWAASKYSNNGFIFLGLALTNLLQKSYVDLIQDTIAQPLGLTSTTGGLPSNDTIDRAVILDPQALAGGDLLQASGGAFSTLNDLALFGTALLNSTQLSPAQTRKWMKPSGHTASLNHSVGAPWEILRYTSPTTGKVSDFYTKSGESGDAVSHFVLVPDYNVGFTYLSVANTVENPQAATVINPILDVLTSSLLPALETQAAAEAGLNFVGTYSSTTPELNATVKIGWNESDVPGAQPALTLLEYNFNNTNLLAPGLLFDAEKPRMLLSFSEVDGQVVFSTSSAANKPSPLGPFTNIKLQNYDWITFGGTTWSGQPVGQFEFEVDGEGRATGVTPAAFGLLLERNNP